MAAIDEAIQKGMEKLGDIPTDNGTGETKGESKTESKESDASPEDKKDDKTEPETKESDSSGLSEAEGDLDQESTEKAKQLYKALANPKTSAAALNFLYETLGYEVPTTKAEVREQTKDIIEEMKDAAPGLEFLVDKIGPIIKKNLESLREEMKQEVETDRVSRQNEVIKNESAQALTSVAKQAGYENDLIPQNILKEMTSMMNKIQPSPDLKPIEYIKMLHDASRAKLGITTNGKANGKGNSPTARLAGEKVSPTVSQATPKKMSINESISAAIKQLAGD